MKFSFGLATFSLFIASVAVSVSAKSSGSAPSDSVCSAAKEKAGSDEVCSLLIEDCMDEVKITSNIWSIPSCVAGATCGGTHNLIQLAKCNNPSVNNIAASDLTSLDYNLYSEIVGDCAWATGGCPITPQNYVDFYYRTLDDLCSDIWPSSADSVLNDHWAPIVQWAAKGESIPYLNFNDWLHWSDSQ